MTILDATWSSHSRRYRTSANNSDNAIGWDAPEAGGDLVAAIRSDLVLLGRALGHLEAILGVEAVARVRGAADLTAVLAMAENLLVASVKPTL
jgi:hypothetical protein